MVTESKAVVARCQGWEGTDGKETRGTFGDDRCIYVFLAMVFDTIVKLNRTLRTDELVWMSLISAWINL